MTSVVYLAIYAGLLIFFAGCLRRILEYSRLPLHLRWELYPVPHEAPSRVNHGGSYFESGEWWLSPQAIHHVGELRVMIQEIVFLKGLREFNPRLWRSSFLFHLGLYLSIVTLALVVFAVLPGVVIPKTESARLAALAFPLCRWVGYAAALAVIAGALLLLRRRITDPAMKNYTKAGDIFNLLFFIVTFAALAAGSLRHASNTASISQITGGLFRFDRSLNIDQGLGTGLVLASALVAYIPFTHMSHFIAKYFTYHCVRWDDRRNERGGAMEGEIAACLNYKPTWAAPHVEADGKKSWAEVATNNPAQEVRK